MILTRVLLTAIGLTLAACGGDAPPSVVDAPTTAGPTAKPQPPADLPEVDASNVDQVRALATSGDASAQYRLGFYLRTEKPLTDASLSEGLDWIRKAAQQALPDAEHFLGTLYQNGECREQATEIPNDAGMTGRPFDSGDLDQWFCETAGLMRPSDSATAIPANINEAIKWFRSAAEQGHSGAQWTLGYIYAAGKGVPEDDVEGLKWYQRAAEYDADLQASLAYAYQTGTEIPKNNAEAMRWLLKAAQQGGASHQFDAGWAYNSGKIVAENNLEAVKWYKLAAAQGHSGAQNNLGAMYDDGDGVTKDDREAVKWYRLSAEQGNANAQKNLGRMYDDGEGVPENDGEAVNWYRLAAEQGNSSAQFRLALAYALGRGLPKDYAESYFWYSIAAAAGEESAAEARDIARERLTQGQVEKAQARAASWSRAEDFADARKRVDPTIASKQETSRTTPVSIDAPAAETSELRRVSYPQGLTASRPESESNAVRETDMVVTSAAARLLASPDGGAIMSLEIGAELALLSRQPRDGWYEVVDVETGTLGWIHQSVVRLELAASPAPPAQIFEARATGIDAPPEVKVENRSDRTIWLRVDGQTHAISSKQTLALSVGAGDKSYTAWAPGVIPAVGIESFKRGYSYGWAFWIETRSGIGIGRRRKR